tara:strand:+ start:410 stop:760 length:351 start_codon:yes stop_codon:yes gene_type:complete
MKIKDLIKQLQQVENKDKYIHLLGNHTNGEDKDFDIFFNNIEVWNDGDESITLFMSHITELDEFGEPIEQTNAKKVLIKYYQNNKEQFLIDCLQGDQNERQYLYNQWIEDFFLVQN